MNYKTNATNVHAGGKNRTSCVSKSEWEPESSLLPELVAEYNGVERELVDEV